MTGDLPEEAINPYAPAGTAPASAAASHLGSFWCSHGHEWQYVSDVGGWLPMVIEADDMHPGDVAVAGQGALPAMCQPATGFDPKEFPNAGPAAVARMRDKVRREWLERRRGER